MTMENMEGDYFVPGTELLENVPKIWKDIQAGFLTCPLKDEQTNFIWPSGHLNFKLFCPRLLSNYSNNILSKFWGPKTWMIPESKSFKHEIDKRQPFYALPLLPDSDWWCHWVVGRSGTVRFQPEGGQERSQQTEGREFLKNMCIRFILLPMFIFCYLVRRWLSGTKLAWLSYSRTAASWTMFGPSFKGILVKAQSWIASWRSGSLGTLAAQDLLKPAKDCIFGKTDFSSERDVESEFHITN